MRRILIDLCFTADVSSPHSAKKVGFEQLYETAEGLSLRAQKDQLLTYEFVFNLLGTKSHRLRNVALFTADGLNEESLINTARALKALGIDPQRVVIDNEEVEL